MAKKMDFQIIDSNSNAKVTLAERAVNKTLTLVDIVVAFDAPSVPKLITLRWAIPIVDMYSLWTPRAGSRRTFGADWGKVAADSRLAAGAPIHQIISQSGKNRYTVALSDAETPISIKSGVIEETAEMEFDLCLFTMLQSEIDNYHATLYIDSSDRPYEQALFAVDEWWRRDCGYPNAYTPDSARRPMYSTWYSLHQDTDPDKIVAQCRLARTLGMDTVIVDDGWQTADGNRGYAWCGDWRPSPARIPDMKKFVDDVHATGMKFMLWYSMPFVGNHSDAYERFRDMSLRYRRRGEDEGWLSLDPRFPEVRAYLVDTYRRAVEDWGLDGLKLDFIDSFRLEPDTPAVDPRRDTESLDVAVDMLLSEVTSALRAIDPEIMIEFRQGYIGPTIRKYGNMFRVGDCPNDAMRNRIGTVDLRFTTGSGAVHSDMLMWSPDESVESAATQVIATLFSVPQISVLLDRIPEEHQKMLAFYLKFWNDNRDILLDGEIAAENPEMLYSCVRGATERGEIAVLYVDKIVNVSRAKFTCINGKGERAITLRFTSPLAEARYRILDCLGRELSAGDGELSGIRTFDVPASGMLVIE